jgi:hypothetical protein
MKKSILVIAILVVSIANAQSQFEQAMGNAMQLWGEGKSNDASALFERIAAAEKNSWLPNYYVAAVNTFAAFNIKDKAQMEAMLNKSQDAIDAEMLKDANNPEILVMQAMIHTAWISADPMTNGMRLSGKVMELYSKAAAIDPNNPRAVFGKAEFEIGAAKWTGADVNDLCKDVEKAVELFDTFKPAIAFAPNWGKDRALKAQKECAKSR